jgi:transposase InsO family protein
VRVAFVDDHRGRYGVEPICRVLPIAPSTYYLCKAREADPGKRPARARRDEQLRREVQRVWLENREVYGVRKIWRQLNREGIRVARCTVARLMGELGIGGVVRGRRCRTTVPSEVGEHPQDLVQRDFTAQRPNQLWVSDLTYVATWCGFVYVAFVIDAFSRRIVGWRVSNSLKSDLALDALEQAIWEREEAARDSLVHHSNRGVQYLSIRYTQRLAEAGIEPSVGSKGDSYDNALAETVIGLFKAEVIRKRGPWRGLEDVEFATLEWVWWFNHRRILEPLGYVPPSECTRKPTTGTRSPKPPWRDSCNELSEKPGAVQFTSSLDARPTRPIGSWSDERLRRARAKACWSTRRSCSAAPGPGTFAPIGCAASWCATTRPPCRSNC